MRLKTFGLCFRRHVAAAILFLPVLMMWPAQALCGAKPDRYEPDNTSSDGIARVWAMIRPPGFVPPPAGNPVSGIPSVDLRQKGEDEHHYEAAYEQFHASGTYQVAIYAMDRIGNISIPKLTNVSVDSPTSRKAILVAGGSQSDPLWPGIEKGMKSAYEALRYQGYGKEDLYLMSPASIGGVDKETVLPSLGSLEHAISTWARDKTQDAVVYLIGDGRSQSFQINPGEKLSAADLNDWLDTLQKSIPGPVSLIYDAPFSGSFLSCLAPPEGMKRIFIAGTGEDAPACFVSDGDVSFSRFFWSQVINGANLRDAFLQAKTSIRYVCPDQVSALDDNGNGIGNEREDGERARGLTLGAGVVLAGDAPVIGAVSPKQKIGAKHKALLWAKDITSTSTITRVWALITPPGQQSGSGCVTSLSTVELKHSGKGIYKGACNKLEADGAHNIAIFAMDKNGSISAPARTKIYRRIEAIEEPL